MSDLPYVEYRAVFSYPPYLRLNGELKASPDDYGTPVRRREDVPLYPPRSEENHGWRTGVQSRYVGPWEDA